MQSWLARSSKRLEARRWARLLLLSGALWCLAHSAWAQRVLVVEPPPDDVVLFEAFGRLRAELALHAFEVVVFESRARSSSPEELEAEAQAREAFAAIALQRHPSGTSADVCIVDRVTGKTVQRRLAIEGSPDGPTLLAIRAVDLLRVSLLELSSGQKPAADVLGVDRAPPPSQVRQFVHEERLFQVRSGAVTFAEPTLGASLGVSLSVRVRPIPRLLLGLQLGGPAFGGEYSASSGSASVRQEYALVDASWNLASSTAGARWEWGPRVGVGVSHLEASGRVTPPLVARSDDVWGVALEAGGGVERFFNDTLSLALELTAFSSLPRPIIAVNDDQSSPVTIQARGALQLGVSF